MKHSGAIPLVFAIMLAACPIADAQSRPSATADGSTELTITVEHDVIKVGDGLTLFITMKNMHKDKYCHHVIAQELQAWLDGYLLEVTDSDGNIYPLKKQPRPRAFSMFHECIYPGKSTSETMDLNRLLDLRVPGVYHMRVSHVDSMTQQAVWSNRIAVTVRQ